MPLLRLSLYSLNPGFCGLDPERRKVWKMDMKDTCSWVLEAFGLLEMHNGRAGQLVNPRRLPKSPRIV